MPRPGRILLAVLAPLVFLLLAFTPFTQRIENQFGLSLLYALRGAVSAPPGAMVVALDRQSIDWLRTMGEDPSSVPPNLAACLPQGTLDELARLRGPSDVPRAVHACLLQALRGIEVPVVVLDILFAVPSDPAQDSLLADALRAHGTTVLLVGFERSTVEEQGAELLVDREIRPYARFEESATAVGAFPVTRSNGPVYGYWPKLPGFGGTDSLVDAARRLVAPSELKTSSKEQGFRYLWYDGQPASVPTISMRDILEGQLPDNLRETAARSVVFVGAADARTTNFVDSFPTFFPSRYGAEMSGVELAATAFLNQLEGRELHRLAPMGEAAVIALFTCDDELCCPRPPPLCPTSDTWNHPPLCVLSLRDFFKRAIVPATGGAGILCRPPHVRPRHSLEISRGAHTDHAAGASPDRKASSRSVAVRSAR